MDSRPDAGEANPVARLFEHVLFERRRALFPPGVAVLDVGSDEARGECGAGFAAPDAAARLGPVEIGRRLRSALCAGAPVLLAFPGARPLPLLVERVLRGTGEASRASAARLGLGDLRRALGTGLEWRRAFALGVLLPGPARADWAAAHPQSFGLMAAVEELVRSWPPLRGWGEVTVLEGVRR